MSCEEFTSHNTGHSRLRINMVEISSRGHLKIPNVSTAMGTGPKQAIVGNVTGWENDQHMQAVVTYQDIAFNPTIELPGDYLYWSTKHSMIT